MVCRLGRSITASLASPARAAIRCRPIEQELTPGRIHKRGWRLLEEIKMLSTDGQYVSGQDVQVTIMPMSEWHQSWIDEAMRLQRYFPGAWLARLRMGRGDDDPICLYYPDADLPFYGNLCAYAEWRWSEIGERDVLAWWFGPGEFDCLPIRFGQVGVSGVLDRSWESA